MRSSFQVIATQEQVEYTNKIVDFSIENHTIPNIWDNNKQKNAQTRHLRFIGSLGETVFADAYNLARHEKAFGANDGQDNGNDFVVTVEQKEYNIDLKSMGRQKDIFYDDYVQNIPSIQLHKTSSVTDLYYCISINQKDNLYYVSFLGLIKKQDIIDGKIGKLYKAGTTRVRRNNTTFAFDDDTYEIEFKDLIKPLITNHIKNMQGFRHIEILSRHFSLLK